MLLLLPVAHKEQIPQIQTQKSKGRQLLPANHTAETVLALLNQKHNQADTATLANKNSIQVSLLSRTFICEGVKGVITKL